MIRELLLWDDDLYEALKRSAKRNYRPLRAEIRAILSQALREDVEAIRRERAERAQQGGEGDALPR